MHAVKVIENWWEPYRVENLETRTVFQQHLDQLGGKGIIHHCKDVRQSYINLFNLQIAFNHNLSSETMVDEEYGGVVVRGVRGDSDCNQNSESIVENVKNGIRINHSYMFWVYLMAWFFIPITFLAILRSFAFNEYMKLAPTSPYIFVLCHFITFFCRSATMRMVQNVVMVMLAIYIMQVYLDTYHLYEYFYKCHENTFC